MHDVAVRDGRLYGVDAGEHPGWSIDNPANQHPGVAAAQQSVRWLRIPHRLDLRLNKYLTHS